MGAVEDRLAAAKLWLISPREMGTARKDGPRGLAYLGQALFQMTTVVTTNVETMTVDERWRVYVNPDWAVATPVPQFGRELAHLTWHLLMEHAARARVMGVSKATAKQWHLAADLTVFDTLDPEAACTTELADAAREARLHRPSSLLPGRSAEEYYAVLSGLPVSRPDGGGDDPADKDWDDGHCGSGCDGIQRSTDMPADADIGGLDHIDAGAVRHQVAIAYQQHAKEIGTKPGEALRWAKGVTDPVIPWEPLLARAVRHAVGWTSGRAERTWTRPSRRQSVTPHFPQPGWRRPVPNIAMVVDTSGSIDDLLLGRAMAEVDGALTALGVPGGSVTVYACDVAATEGRAVRGSADVVLVGGGGTDMRVGIAAAGEARPRPDLIVVFTDGFTPWPASPPPGSAVIVAILRRPDEDTPAVPSWATRIDCVLT